MWKGIDNNEVDAAIGSTIAGQVKEMRNLAARHRLSAAPGADKAGWARVNKVGPYFYQHKATCGAGISTGQAGQDGLLPLPDL